MRRSLGPAFNPDRRACSLLTDCVAVDTGVILKGKNDLSVHKSWKFSHDLEQFCTGQKSIFTKILTLDSHTIFFWPTFQNKQLWSYFGSFSLRYLLPVNGVEGARLLVWKQKLEKLTYKSGEVYWNSWNDSRCMVYSYPTQGRWTPEFFKVVTGISRRWWWGGGGGGRGSN